MPRYMVMPPDFDRYFDVRPEPMLPDVEVSEPRSVDTGLVDVRGQAIHRVSEPIGFGREQER